MSSTQETSASITDFENEEIARAKQPGHTPVVFVHGLWLLASSWDRWAALFQQAGYATLQPGWPDDPQTVEEANADPEVFAGKTSARSPITTRRSSDSWSARRRSWVTRSEGCSRRSSRVEVCPP